MELHNHSINSSSLKFKYCKSVFQNNMRYGAIMIAVGLFAVAVNKESVFSYLWIGIGILQAATAWYKMQSHYLSVEKGKLIKHSFFPKSLALSEIKKVREYRKSYQVETENSKMYIDKKFLASDALPKLNQFMDSLNPEISTVK